MVGNSQFKCKKSEGNKNEWNKIQWNKNCVTKQNKIQWNKNWFGPLDFGWWGPPSLSAKRSEWNKNEQNKICVTQQNKNQQNKNWLGPSDFGWWGSSVYVQKGQSRTKIVLPSRIQIGLGFWTLGGWTPS